MNVRANGHALATATTKLMREWSQARAHWRDSKADEFERKYLLELQTRVDQAGLVLEQIEKIVKQVREQCE
jgi:thymidylate synthase